MAFRRKVKKHCVLLTLVVSTLLVIDLLLLSWKFLSILQLTQPVTQWKPANPSTKSHATLDHLHSILNHSNSNDLNQSENHYQHHSQNWSSLLSLLNSSKLAIIEPLVLIRQLDDQEREFLSDRFDVVLNYSQCSHCITIGVLGQEAMLKVNLSGENFTTLSSIVQPHPINSYQLVLCHLFARHIETNLTIHFVVFHQINYYLWIGEIWKKGDPEVRLPDQFILHYGKSGQEIYDLFVVSQNELFPGDIFDFLSQRNSSRYVHCPPSRQQWLTSNHIEIDLATYTKFEESLVTMKSLMRSLRLPFWMMCGTLLGWHRQCHITPYTSDTDFATMARFFTQPGLSTAELKQEAPNHGLYLTQRFGHVNFSVEYSLETKRDQWKVDIFGIYSNQTHFSMAVHVQPLYTFQYYPSYQLCSGVLLGYKLLVPCNPEDIVLVEYGENWQKPRKDWDYANSPKNMGEYNQYPGIKFGAQYEGFD